ncbi:MAG: hypothetical protein WBZ20_14630 [Nitrososphaeraceae archaeon]
MDLLVFILNMQINIQVCNSSGGSSSIIIIIIIIIIDTVILPAG